MEYIPHPIDTSDIVISEDIRRIAELLSKNTHDIWAKSKIDEGYVYGEITDDLNKTHNCLLPYESLPDIQKEYDYNISLEYIKVLLKLGFKIEKEGNRNG